MKYKIDKNYVEKTNYGKQILPVAKTKMDKLVSTQSLATAKLANAQYYVKSNGHYFGDGF